MSDDKHMQNAADATAVMKGTWIRSKVPVSDDGDHNHRKADAGALGLVDEVRTDGGSPSFVVVFWPSFIANVWELDEISRDADVLSPDDPAIPSAMAFELPSAVCDILVDGEIDEDTNTITVPEEVMVRISGAAGAIPEHAAEIHKLMMADLGPGEVTLSFEEFDRLAEMTGIGDRLDPSLGHSAGLAP